MRHFEEFRHGMQLQYVSTHLLNHIMHANRPSSGYKHLTDIQIDRCLSLNHAGWSLRKIAMEIPCSKSTVGRILKQYDYKTFAGRKQHPGRARKTTESDDRLLIRVAKKHYNLPFRDITSISSLSISLKTMARRCREVQLISRYARHKPHLTSKHKKDRLEWALRYQDYTFEDWCKVIWSDECLMRIGVDIQRHCVLRPKGKELEKKYLTSSFKSEHVTIII